MIIRSGEFLAFDLAKKLQSMLTEVKESLLPDFQCKVIYKNPCSCGKAYIHETIRHLKTWSPGVLLSHADSSRTQGCMH